MKPNRKGTWLSTVVLIATIVTSGVALHSNSLNKSTSIQEDDTAQMPIADYSAPEAIDPGERAKRKAKNKRYDKSSSQPIKEEKEPIIRVLSGHWAKGLPALPVEQSDIIIIGEVTGAQAYLSNDKTGVYSEFTLRVEEAL